MDEDIVVGAFPKNNREEIRVTLSNFKGHDLLGIRTWYGIDKDDPKPGKAGISVNVRLIPDLIDTLNKAADIASEKGLLAEGDEVPPPPEPPPEDNPPF